jgi:hypothetical protein
MNADAHFHFIVSQREIRSPRRRYGARRQRYPHRACAPVDVVAERLERAKAGAGFCRGADHLFHDQRTRDAAPAGRVSRIFNRNVVATSRPAISAAMVKFITSPS